MQLEMSVASGRALSCLDPFFLRHPREGGDPAHLRRGHWIPAFAGMTKGEQCYAERRTLEAINKHFVSCH